MAADNRLLLIALEDRSSPIREQLLGLGFLPFEVGGLEEAASEFARGNPLSSTVFLSTRIDRRGLRPGLERLRSLRPELRVVAIGPEPAPEVAEALRAAGVTTVLRPPLERAALESALACGARAPE